MFEPRSKKRSPLKQKALRSPGDSLHEERERIVMDRVLVWIMASVFLGLLAGMEWWRLLTQSPPQPVILTVLAAAVIAFTALRIHRVLPEIRALNLGLEGERAVGQLLESERQPEWRVFHDVPGKGFNVDHVLVAPQGIFAIETKTFSKPAKGKASVSYDGATVRVNGHVPHRDPIAQVAASRDWLRDLLLDMTGKRYQVRGVVLFPGWFVETPSGLRPDVWVLNEKAFLKYVENERNCIEPEDVALAASRIALHVTATTST